MNKQKAKRKMRRLGAVGAIFAEGKKERMDQRSVGGLLQMFELSGTAGKNEKRNEKPPGHP